MAKVTLAMRLGCLALIALQAIMPVHSQDVLQQEVPLGGKVTLNCNSPDGSQVFWRVPPRNQRVSQSSVSVVMDNAAKYGAYRCYSQAAGRAPSLGRTVKLIRPISKINLDESLFIVSLNSRYTLYCPINFGARNTNWLRFDKRRQVWRQIRRSAPNSYTISRVRQSDITTWRCEATNALPASGRYAANMVLSTGYVTKPRAKLTARSELGSDLYLVKENRKKFVMECEPVAGSNADQIAWEFKNPNQVGLDTTNNEGYVAVGRDAATENAQVQSAGDFSVLEINKCQTQNSGFYRCKMPNGGRRYARLQVKRREPEIHRFGKGGVRKKEASKGESVAFHCSLDMQGVSPSDLFWVYRPKGRESDPSAEVEYRMGAPTSGGVTVSQVGDRSRLQISNAQKANEGRYICQYNDVSDYTDLIVGAGFMASLTTRSSFNSLSLSCSVTRNGAPDPARYYRFTYYEQKENGRQVVRNYRRVPRYSMNDRTYVCVATHRAKSKSSESAPLEVKGVKLSLMAQTPTGLRRGAPLTLRCESSDKTVSGNMLSLTLSGRRAPYSQRKEVSGGVVDFKYARVTKRNTGDYQCVLARTIRSNQVKAVVCETTERLCRDMSKCYPVNRKCDGRRDCADGSDEDRNQCMDCEPHSLKCQRYNRRNADVKCVLKHWICDGQDDCGNGWDEFVNNGYCKKHPVPQLNCPGCGRNETCCSNGQCFPRAYECDRETDCPADGIDESTCTCGESSQLEVVNPLAEESRLVRRGASIELTCQVRGKERPTINWRFNWGHLPDDRRFVESMSVTQVTPDGGQGAAEVYSVQGKLSITNINPKTDIGRYTCEAITKCKRILVPDYILSLDTSPPF